VTALCETARELVGHYLGTAGLRVLEIAPVEDGYVHPALVLRSWKRGPFRGATANHANPTKSSHIESEIR
jgi:hypothetical protein